MNAVKKFWAEQFNNDTPTKQQLTFDVLVGVFLPIICLAADRVLIGRYTDFSIFQQFKAFGYTGIAISVVSLIIWIRYKRPKKMLAGWLSASAVFSMLISVPFTLLSIIFFFLMLSMIPNPSPAGSFVFLIGSLLCLPPLLTALVYGRNARRALKAINTDKLQWKNTAVALGFILCFAIPALIQVVTRQATEKIIKGNANKIAVATQLLKHSRYVITVDELVREYESISDETRRSVIAAAYQEITGGNILVRLREIKEADWD